MSLSISVGILADLQQSDPETVPVFQKEFDAINRALARHRLPQQVEPLDIEPWADPLGLCGFPYSWIHYLRRYYAHRLARPDQVPAILETGQRPTDDRVLDQMSSPASHLVWHSDAEGFYVPIDFRTVIEDENVLGGMLGSSQRLLQELLILASPLGFNVQDGNVSDDQVQAVVESLEKESPLFIEKATWLILFDAAKSSIANRAAICFG